MNRLVLFAVLLSQSSLIFCQSTATPPGGPQVPGKVSMGQWPFSFSNVKPGQTATRPTFRSFDCHDSNITQNQANPPADLDHLFDTSCTDVKSQVEFLARNESSFSRSPLVVGPHPNGEPIPTQLPNAKGERIPTQWPYLAAANRRNLSGCSSRSPQGKIIVPQSSTVVEAGADRIRYSFTARLRS